MAPLSLLLATLPMVAAGPVGDLTRGHQAFQAGDYRKAARVLGSLPGKLPRTGDYALFFAAESEFYAGRPARALALFTRLANEKESRFAALAPWRAADCLWADGRKADAAAAYRRLLAAATPPGVDPVVARFRVATLAPPAEAAKLWRKIHVEQPAHPLADEAARRAGPAEAPGEPPAATEPRARLRRAARLTEGRKLEEAMAELKALPPNLPPELQAERDFEMGMAKFRTRSDYPEAAELLLGVVPRLTGEKAAFAAFHGARALARAHREDEAIAATVRVVERFPTSRWAAEAQFVTGWLEFNRGRYAESLPGLRGTLERYGRSAFANDAAWYLALAAHFLGRHDEALAALADYARLSGSDADAARRASYWRARFLAAKGSNEEARGLWRELCQQQPLSYYGLLARSRLRQAGETVAVKLPPSDEPLRKLPRKALRDPAILRAEELERAGLGVEAGTDLQRSEDELQERLGKDQALALLFDRYSRYQAFRRAYQLAGTRGSASLEVAPVGGARLTWEAAHPRAYRALVEKYSKTAKVPPLFVYSIMHKESGFGPHVTSPADARGLLQLLPTLGAPLAKKRRLRFFDDDLFQPEVNIRLGAFHLGELVGAFRGQVFLAAGAYNGGVKAVLRWLDQNGRRPFDEFVELVGYKDSREYIKRVTAIYARYLYLYTGKPYELPLTVKPAVRNALARVTLPVRVVDPDL